MLSFWSWGWQVNYTPNIVFSKGDQVDDIINQLYLSKDSSYNFVPFRKLKKNSARDLFRLNERDTVFL